MKQLMFRCALAVTWAIIGCAQPAGAATVEVTTSGLSFAPADVTIDLGDSVHWTGLMPNHNVAQTAAADCGAGIGFTSGAPGAVAEFTHTFDTPGIHYYKCETHCAGAAMMGTVTVNEEAVPTISE